MNDKEREIKELKDKLSQLEGSNSSDNKKKEVKKLGCFAQVVVIFIILGVIGAFTPDDFGGFSSTKVIKTEQQETPKVDIAEQNRSQIIASLAQQDFQAYWGQDNSLWIENPGYSNSELEIFGYKFCDITKNAGMKQSYIITFWQSLRNGPNGQILKVNCFK